MLLICVCVCVNVDSIASKLWPYDPRHQEFTAWAGL